MPVTPSASSFVPDVILPSDLVVNQEVPPEYIELYGDPLGFFQFLSESDPTQMDTPSLDVVTIC